MYGSYSGFSLRQEYFFSLNSHRKKKKTCFKLPYCPLLINGINTEYPCVDTYMPSHIVYSLTQGIAF